MKKIFQRVILPFLNNKLTWITSEASDKVLWGIVGIALVVCLTLFFLMIGRINEKVAFFVDGISLYTDEVTVGENSDVAYMGVPHDYLTVSRAEGDSIHWKVNPVYYNTDSLQYIKINDINPNRVSIQDSQDQKISVTIPSTVEEGKQLTLTLTGHDIWEEWKSFDKQREVMLRHFAVHYEARHSGYPEPDSLGYMQQKKVRSFLHKEGKKGISLVILDNKTTVTDSVTHTYISEGSVKGPIKVQFCRMSDHCYLVEDEEDGTFKVNKVNYVAKASVKLTEWGAGHVMIIPETSSWDIRLPKAAGIVESLDTINSMEKNGGGIITIHQSQITYPSRNDIYLPEMSAAISSDICMLEKTNGNLYVRSSPKDSVEVTGGWHLAPTLQRRTMTTDNGTIDYRVGYIGKPFIYGYLLLPLLVMAAIILFVALPMSPVRLKKHYIDRFPSKEIQFYRHYPGYLSLLTIIAFCYCICKSLIALKLSYTYPYFESITGITPVSTALMLLLFFTVAMLINTPLLRAVAGQKKGKDSYPWSTLLFILVIFAGITAYYFRILDPAVSKSVLASYFAGEIYTAKVWTWMEASGINDTHRSVVYALMFVESAVLVQWSIVLLFWNSISKSIVKISQLLCPDTSKYSYLYFIFWHAVLLVVLFATGMAAGNFGTAFITLGVILGLSSALRYIIILIQRKEILPWVGFYIMAFTTVVYIAAAMFGDHGYLTNYIGFLLAFIAVFFLTWSPGMTTSENKKERTSKKYIYWGMLLVAIIACLTPSLLSNWFDAEDVDYSRMTRRILLYSDFDELQEAGYRYTDTDAEFMTVMSHYMQQPYSGDPLSNETHVLHASVSSGQSPVVLNDLSVPIAFFGSYGTVLTSTVFFLLLLSLLCLVSRYCTSSEHLSRQMQWRLTAVMMWTGTTLYIYLSYLGRLPFTGRLIPGFGVDAVGEAIETAVLLAFMSAMQFSRASNSRTNN